MFQTSKAIKTSDLSILIVDKSEFEIATSKRWLEQLGISNIKTATTMKKAISLLKKENINLVFCEYELPDSTAIELMRELKALENKLPSFSIMTSNNNKETIVELLEATPDDILIKPFSYESFFSRVNKIIKRYKMTIDIRNAIATKDYEQALRLSSDKKFDELVLSNQAFASWLERTKIEIMINQGRMKNVEQYTNLLLTNPKYNLEWVHSYHIQSLLEQNLLESVIDKAEECLMRHPLSIKSYLFLGEAYYRKGHLKHSTKNYNRALELSKNSIAARRSVSKVFHEIGDYENALSSYNKLMQLVDKSIDKKPEDFHHFANLKKEKAEMIIEDNLNVAISESIEILKKGQEAFPDDIIMDVLSEIMEAQKILIKGNQQGALKRLESIMHEFEYVLNRNGAVLLNTILTYQQLGNDFKASELKQKLLLSKDKLDVPQKTFESRSSSFKNKDTDTYKKASSYIKLGQSNYQEGKVFSSLDYFEKAYDLAPDSISIGFKLMDLRLQILEEMTVENDFIEDTIRFLKMLSPKIKTEMDSDKISNFDKRFKMIQEKSEILARNQKEKRKRILKKEKEEKSNLLSSTFIKKDAEGLVEKIEKIKLKRSDVTDSQLVALYKLREEKNFTALKNMLREIKESVYLKGLNQNEVY